MKFGSRTIKKVKKTMKVDRKTVVIVMLAILCVSMFAIYVQQCRQNFTMISVAKTPLYTSAVSDKLYAFLHTTNRDYLNERGIARVNAGRDNITVIIFPETSNLNLEISEELTRTIKYQQCNWWICESNGSKWQCRYVNASKYVFQAPQTVGIYHFRIVQNTRIIASFTIISDKITVTTKIEGE